MFGDWITLCGVLQFISCMCWSSLGVVSCNAFCYYLEQCSRSCYFVEEVLGKSWYFYSPRTARRRAASARRLLVSLWNASTGWYTIFWFFRFYAWCGRGCRFSCGVVICDRDIAISRFIAYYSYALIGSCAVLHLLSSGLRKSGVCSKNYLRSILRCGAF